MKQSFGILLMIISIVNCASITYENFDFECSHFTPTSKQEMKLTKNESELNDLYLNYYHKVHSIHSKKTLLNGEEITYSKYNCKHKNSKNFVTDERLIDFSKMEKLSFFYKVLKGPLVSKCATKSNEKLEININLVERRPKGFKLKFVLDLITDQFQKQETFYELIKFYGCSALINNPPYYFSINSNASLNCSELADSVEFIKHDLLNNQEETVTSNKKYKIENNVLKITNLDESDFQSTFECVSKTYKINRKFNMHPYIKEVRVNSKIVLAGSNLDLKCDLTRPVIKSAFSHLKWYKSTGDSKIKEEIINNTNSIVSLSYDNFKIHLTNLSEKDVGTYFCTIQNEYGTFSREFYVDIYSYKFLLLMFSITTFVVFLLSIIIILLCK